jgi:LysR family hydrogen peroxide-inducible transcriptional activator
VDFARRSGRLLSGNIKLGIIPTLAPYVLPKLLPVLQERYPELHLELHETPTKILLEELTGGELDLVLLALPVVDAEIETIRMFEDRFLLAVPAEDPLPATARVSATQVDQRRLILLEEGHCLRDQALTYCAGAPHVAPIARGATSLATVMQMVANGYGVTLVPEVAIDVEVRDERVKLLRFASGAGPHDRTWLASDLAAQSRLRRARAAHYRGVGFHREAEGRQAKAAAS